MRFNDQDLANLLESGEVPPNKSGFSLGPEKRNVRSCARTFINFLKRTRPEYIFVTAVLHEGKAYKFYVHKGPCPSGKNSYFYVEEVLQRGDGTPYATQQFYRGETRSFKVLPLHLLKTLQIQTDQKPVMVSAYNLLLKHVGREI